MEDFQGIKNRLELTEDNRLVLGDVPMILIPRWFFVGIMKRFADRVGADIAAEVYYDAGFDGAYKWAKVQMAEGLSGQAVMAQYLGSMTHRGWGRFEILEFDEEKGLGRFRYFSSAVALELGNTGNIECIWVPGAIAGGFQAILDQSGRDLVVKGKETSCLSQGLPYCEISVEPILNNA